MKIGGWKKERELYLHSICTADSHLLRLFSRRAGPSGGSLRASLWRASSVSPSSQWRAPISPQPPSSAAARASRCSARALCPRASLWPGWNIPYPWCSPAAEGSSFSNGGSSTPLGQPPQWFRLGFASGLSCIAGRRASARANLAISSTHLKELRHVVPSVDLGSPRRNISLTFPPIMRAPIQAASGLPFPVGPGATQPPEGAVELAGLCTSADPADCGRASMRRLGVLWAVAVGVDWCLAWCAGCAGCASLEAVRALVCAHYVLNRLRV